MAVTTVALRFGPDGKTQLTLRPLTGADERDASANAQRLLERLATPPATAGSPSGLGHLLVGDRDRALAALYTVLYGSAITADATCRSCTKRFELRFDLDALAASRTPDGSAFGDPPSVDLDGGVYRLPTVADLTGSPGTLVERLHVSGPAARIDDVESALEAADPALVVDLTGSCPECDQEQATPFSMLEFFSASLQRDASYLWREVHTIASSYRWGLDQIFSMTRQERQTLVGLIIGENDTLAQVRSLAS